MRNLARLLPHAAARLAAGLLCVAAEGVDLRPVTLDLLRVIEECEHVGALAEPEARIGKVVVRIGLVERACARQRFPSAGVAAKGGAIAIAGELGKARHNRRFLIIETFDQQVPPVGLCDDLLMAEQAAQFTLKFVRLMFGGYGWHVCLSITMCPFATDSPEKSI